MKEFEIKKLSPNPARTDLTVEYDAENAVAASLSIFNAKGVNSSFKYSVGCHNIECF